MDIALKQRLVGASVLIALAVIVLPMLLGGKPESEVAESRKIEVPAQPEDLDFETRRYPIGETPVPAPQTGGQSAPVRPLPSPPQKEPENADPVSAPASGPDTAAQQAPAVPKPEPEPEPAPETPVDRAPEAEAEGDGRYVVQVASFGSLSNANRLSDVLSGFGYAVMLDSVKSDVGTLNRVRVGPYATEAAAGAAVAKIKSQVADLNPRVMDLQPDKASQVSTVSDPLVRWIVQVGVFSSATNADNLVARLRNESLSAYQEQVDSSGSRVYRVRVGPFLERQEALRVDKLIFERFSLDGVVMSAN